MTRVAIFLTILPISLFLAGTVLDFADEPQVNVVACMQRDLEVKERTLNYYCFKRGFEATLASLAKGEVCLREAHARVLVLARQYHPKYLTVLAVSEKGATLEECLARNLVAHVENIAESHPPARARVPILENELHQMLAPRNP